MTQARDEVCVSRIPWATRYLLISLATYNMCVDLFFLQKHWEAHPAGFAAATRIVCIAPPFLNMIGAGFVLQRDRRERNLERIALESHPTCFGLLML